MNKVSAYDQTNKVSPTDARRNDVQGNEVPKVDAPPHAAARCIATREELRQAIQHARGEGKSIGLVPTMGALHAGHLSLVAASTEQCDFTVVTIFVNPTQFGPAEDYRRYPRDRDADLAALAAYPVDLVFAPPVEEIYRPGGSTTVHVRGLTEVLEGAFRPGHFDGVATVVLKLLNLTTPDVAFFGQKDYQQTLVVRRLAADLDVPVEIRVCPTVREDDGLALSSRNAYLTPPLRLQALAISQSLDLAETLVQGGERSADVIRRAVHQRLAEEPDLRVQYAAVVDPETLADVTEIAGPTLLAIAALVGETRLIDNRIILPTAVK